LVSHAAWPTVGLISLWRKSGGLISASRRHIAKGARRRTTELSSFSSELVRGLFPGRDSLAVARLHCTD
jgi:hypothetical protein